MALVVGTGAIAVPRADATTAAATGSPAPPMTAHARPGSGLSVDTVRIPATTTDRSSGVVAQLAPTRVSRFGLLGVTWDAGTAAAATRFEVRLRDADGWGPAQLLHWEPSEGPSPGEELTARDGTGPLWVGAATGLAVRVETPSGVHPAGLRVVTVDPGAASAPGVESRGVAGPRPPSGDPITGPARFPGLPGLITRRQWGADPALTDTCSSPRYGRTAKMVFVHHTVNDNDYSARESPAIVRAIYAYHTQGQGWCDIGYNALIDRFGNIYEGRRGGIRRAVRGAHAGDFNTGSVGVSLIGNFEERKPSARMKNALVRFVGWRLGTGYKPVRGEVEVAGADFNRIAGHRDAMATACPGRYAYAALPRIRARVAAYLSTYDSRLAKKAKALGTNTTGPLRKGEQRVAGGFRTVFGKGIMYGKKGPGVHLLPGRVLGRYLRSGGVKGVLGWPKSDVRGTPVSGARVLIAQHGRMYLRAGKAKVIHGPIFRRYSKTGLATGRLGFPVSNVRRTDIGARADFQHGWIRWNRSSGKTTVRFT